MLNVSLTQAGLTYVKRKSTVCIETGTEFSNGSTVESRSNGPARNGNLPITEDILWFLEKLFFNFYIGNNRNPPITDKNGWSLEIR